MNHNKFKLAQALRFRFEDNLYVCLLPYNFIAASFVFFCIAMLFLEFVEQKYLTKIHFSSFFIVLSLILLSVGCCLLVFRKIQVEIRNFKQKSRF